MFRTTIQVNTHGEGEVVNLTSRVAQAVAESGVREGLANVFVAGSTAAVTTIEYEPGVLSDLSRALSVIAPADIPYAHDAAWGDGNGRSHVRAAIVARWSAEGSPAAPGSRSSSWSSTSGRAARGRYTSPCSVEHRKMREPQFRQPQSVRGQGCDVRCNPRSSALLCRNRSRMSDF